jgi:hypothetical protein
MFKNFTGNKTENNSPECKNISSSEAWKQANSLDPPYVYVNVYGKVNEKNNSQENDQ